MKESKVLSARALGVLRDAVKADHDRRYDLGHGGLFDPLCRLDGG